MIDGGYMTSGKAISGPKPVPDGPADHLAEQVSIEADRFTGTVKDGVEAVQTASKRYGDQFVETCARIIQASMQTGIDAGEHLLALLRAKNPADVVQLNIDFVQKNLLSAQGRLFEIIGVKQPAFDRDDRTAGRA